LGRHVPIDNFLWLSPCLRSRYSEVVHKEDNKDREKQSPLDKASMFSLRQRDDTINARKCRVTMTSTLQYKATASSSPLQLCFERAPWVTLSTAGHPISGQVCTPS
jgi:hypothetical protein